MIGVNKYQPTDEAPIDVLKVDNSAVMQMQLDKLRRLKAERDPAALKEALDALTRAADRGNGNLLALAIDAARAKATVGEISMALEKVYGRHRAEIKAITGVYKREVGMTGAVERVRVAVEAFEAAEGRRPRLLVAKIGQDGHDRGQKVIASAFADLGFDVDIGPLFATPAEAARQAVENDVHILGVSSLAAAHLTLVPELKKELASAGPRRHHDRGRRRGAAAGLRRADEGRLRGDLPARHGDRGGGREAAQDPQQAVGPRKRGGGVKSSPRPRGLCRALRPRSCRAASIRRARSSPMRSRCWGRSLNLQLYALRDGHAHDPERARFVWNGKLYAQSGHGMNDVNGFTVHPFEGGDFIIQSLPTGIRSIAEYAVMHQLADGVYQVIAIDEDDADAATRAAHCKHPGGTACRIETREQLFTFARATAAKQKTGGGLAIRLEDARRSPLDAMAARTVKPSALARRHQGRRPRDAWRAPSR